jgi:hypothetical protein
VQMNRVGLRKGHIMGRFILGAVGVMMIALALMTILLYFMGDTAQAQVSTRRVGGSRDGAPADSRYEWSIDYEFTAANGSTYYGTTTRRGSDMSVKFDRKVYYFKAVPNLNALAGEVRPNVGQLVMIGLGVFLVSVAFGRFGRNT